MIRNESEYREAVKRIDEEGERLRDQEKKLGEMNLSPEQIKRAMDPVLSFHEQLREEVASYERLCRQEFEEVRNFAGVGQLLIALRIAQGTSQRELAQRLSVHESQVSRDERNDYRGITMERAGRVLAALGVELTTRVDRVRGEPVGAS